MHIIVTAIKIATFTLQDDVDDYCQSNHSKMSFRRSCCLVELAHHWFGQTREGRGQQLENSHTRETLNKTKNFSV